MVIWGYIYFHCGQNKSNMTGNVFFYIPPIEMVIFLGDGWGKKHDLIGTMLFKGLFILFLPYFRLGNYDHLPKTHGDLGSNIWRITQLIVLSK
jgi:hypothetical protein